MARTGRRLKAQFLNPTVGPIIGVCTGPAAPITTTIELPPGLFCATSTSFQLLVIQRLPEGSTWPAVFRSSASLT